MDGWAARRRWVFMRGLARTQAHWGGFVDHFRAKFPQAIVDTLDLPGFGERRALRAPLTIAGTLAKVREGIRQHAALPDRVWLLGLSLGGMVAYEWMRQHHDEVAGVVLVNTSLGASWPWRRL